MSSLGDSLENQPLYGWFFSNQHLIAGLDEAGRGPLAGPVVAACVVLNPEKPIAALNDSKKLTPKKRDSLFDEIHEKALCIGVHFVSASEIDTTNILRAALTAMKFAFEQAQVNIATGLIGALVDGNQRVPDLMVTQHTVVGGDGIWPCIMAASIVAKVMRDRYMLDLDAQHPGYGFAAHKGYGTKAHMLAIEKLGPCLEHRMSFEPLKSQYRERYGATGAWQMG